MLGTEYTGTYGYVSARLLCIDCLHMPLLSVALVSLPSFASVPLPSVASVPSLLVVSVLSCICARMLSCVLCMFDMMLYVCIVRVFIVCAYVACVVLVTCSVRRVA